MKLGWLIGGGLLGAAFLVMPACGSDDGGDATSPDAGANLPDGSLADVTTGPDGAGTDSGADAGGDANVAPPACNDGKIDLGETCDPLASCPTACAPVGCQFRALDNGGTCTAVCDNTAVQTNCINGDGCCPTGCGTTNDTDCTAMCGNGVIEKGETCDGNCPTTCANVGCQPQKVVLDNANPCTAHCVDDGPAITQCSTSADKCCPTATCVTDPDCGVNVCGNGTVDSNETCDPGPGSPTKCPTSCAPQTGCTMHELKNPNTCTASCVDEPVTSCVNSDGCCPTGCNANNDSDCAPVCGNDVVEKGEDCDGNCPTSCPPNGCQQFQLIDNGACHVVCKAGQQQTSCVNNDQCCPSGCTGANDTDCASTTPTQCGDGVIEPPETCDNGANSPTKCPTCVQPKQCFQNLGSAEKCSTQCNVPIETCSGTVHDGCCPFGAPGGRTCGSDTDPDCGGKQWQFVSATAPTTVKAGTCASFVIAQIQSGASYDFTTCAQADSGSKPTGDTRITDSKQAGFQTVSIPTANDDCTEPSSLPLLAGWSCANAASAVKMSCGSADAGGFTTGSSNPITTQVCAGTDDATFTFSVFYNALTKPTIALGANGGATGNQ